VKLRLARRLGAPFAVGLGAAALAVLVATPAVASPIFCGGGAALTADLAVRSAFEDAQISAQSEGFYGPCRLVGEPETFEVFNDPYFGHRFFAQVNVVCLP
jgi:hypothetical protein